MINILNENFTKEVKKELHKKSNGFNKVVVNYHIDNENKNGTLSIAIWNSIEKKTEITTPIKFDLRLNSMGIRDGRPIRRIVFELYPTDYILDIITNDHYIECWGNAYDWTFTIHEQNKVPNPTHYHISMICFYNTKRNKSSRIQQNCFNGFEMIYTEERSY